MQHTTHHQKEQILKELKRIRKETDDLQLSMRCYKGESLSSLHYEDLVELEKQLECSVNKVRARKFELLQQQVDNLRRKEKMLEVENQQIQYHLHQVATLEQQHAAVAMVKPEEQQRMLEEFQFFGDEQPIISLPKSSFRHKARLMHLPGFGFGVLIHVLLLWLFIIEFRWGTAGAALAFDITSGGVALAEKIIRQTIFFLVKTSSYYTKKYLRGKKGAHIEYSGLHPLAMDPSEEHHSIGPTGKLHKHKPQATER
ncbi:hypothetical protein D5086_027478 [Populus alba]|uniref:Uncharacterized protein n=1 Tax=Populus alba TaxID=43335 RepID=A0ACC4AW41_POPAL